MKTIICLLVVVACNGDITQETTGEHLIEMCGPIPEYSATYDTIGSYGGPRDTATMWRDQFEALIAWQDCAKDLP